MIVLKYEIRFILFHVQKKLEDLINTIYEQYIIYMNPVAFSIGCFNVRWYGLAYLATFIISMKLVKNTIKFQKPIAFKSSDIDSCLNYVIAGVILGGRIGEFVFYKHKLFTMEIFYITKGGMSFHGGVCGVIIASLIFAKLHKKNLLQLGDLITMCVPIGSFLGRIGNYINQEILGKSTTIFEPYLSEHPVVFYEAFLEGIVLFLILFRRKKLAITGRITSEFFIFYGLFRFCTEFVRVSDGSLGILSIAQWLSIGMIIFGSILRYKH